ncbi:hypothetical protein K466DRAFT_605175 [Polyporus arcularius HHB13444]|uniref:F-box domain-containing protein n=1 Tax=Polyporus arcularius HHB13444 TaxID=1314778 RepID=A0A5C3NUE0_9APHY|nr:hypothetical protein K466DRAFT_605175 [Polyporus arcularius HHB13444]
MRLLELDDDVLLSIFSHLYGTNALSVALTCSEAYRLVIPRVVAVIVCSSPDQLRRLHAYLRGHDGRARHVEDFELTLSAYYPLEYEVDEESTTLIDAHFIQACLVANILLQLIQAKGLHRLVLHQLHPLSQKDPRMIPALLALDGLSCMALNMVGDCCIAAFQGASFSNLRTLVLRFHNGVRVAIDPLVDREPNTYIPLLQLLSLLPKLHFLKLHFFTPDRWLDSHAVTATPSFPSIRQLELEQATPAALQLAHLCSNLAVLSIQLLRGVPGDTSISPPGRWPPLHRLEIRGLKELMCVKPFLQTIHHLEIMIDHICLDHHVLKFILGLTKLETFRQASPVSVSMTILPDMRAASFWSQVAIDAPRLRVLDLRIAASALLVDPRNWLIIMPPCLGCLPLVSLLIRLPVDIALQARNVFSSRSVEERRQTESAHSAVLIVGTEMIRQVIPASIPTLRFFALTGARAPTVFEEAATQSHPDLSPMTNLKLGSFLATVHAAATRDRYPHGTGYSIPSTINPMQSQETHQVSAYPADILDSTRGRSFSSFTVVHGLPNSSTAMNLKDF